MALPRQRSTQYEIKPDLVEAFLNRVLMPVANCKVKKDDIQEFIKLMTEGNDHSLLETISESNPFLLIRLFFPTVQLPHSLLTFLCEVVFVFRSEAGLYQYPHSNSSNGLRTRHEVRMGFQELFLLVNYGLNFRVMSTENENNVGIWNRSLLKVFEGDATQNANFQLEIIPPKRQDLFTLLNEVAVLQTFSDRFTLPIIDSSPHRLINSGKLKNVFKAAFKNLESTVNQSIIDVFAAPPVAADISSKQEITEEDIDVMEKADSIISSLKLPLKFDQMGHTIVMHAQCEQESAEKDFYNYIVLQYVLVAGNHYYSKVAESARDAMYKGDEPITDSSKSIKAWLDQILSSVCNDEADNIFDSSLHGYQALLKNHWKSNIRLLSYSHSMPIALFNSIFTPKTITILNGYDKKQLDLKAKKEVDVSKASSEKLLEQLMTTTRLHESTFFIRKILSRNNSNQRLSMTHLQKEFGFNGSVEDHLRIRPATFIAPGLPIETYQQVWAASSGVIIIIPPGDAVPMVGYKRPAASDSLTGQRMNTLGFPFKGEATMRVHGGKPSYSVEDFFNRLYIIYFRSKSLIEDSSRKEYFKNLFINLQNDLATHKFLSRELQLSLDEIENGAALAPDSSDDYKIYSKICTIIKNNFRRLPKFVAEHYYLTFKSLIIDALGAKQSLLVVLSNREIKSYKQRMINLKINLYMPELANLPERILSQIATAGHRYARQTKFPSNETLLQGLRVYDKSVDNQYPVISIDSDETIIIKRHLLKRHGNFPAVYVNRSSSSGLTDAILIHMFFKKQFNQELVFVAYDEKSFRITICSVQDFKRLNSVAWDNCEKQDNTINPLQQTLMPTLGLGLGSGSMPPQVSFPQPLIASKPFRRGTNIRPFSQQPSPPPTENFKTSPQWTENCEIMLKKVNSLSILLEQIYHQLNRKNPHVINKNFNCTYSLMIKVSRSNLYFYKTIYTEMKCINGIFVFEYIAPRKNAETVLKQLLRNINDSNHNPDNQPLTNNSFKLELDVSHVKASKRDVDEKLYFGQNKSHFITYAHERNNDTHMTSHIDKLHKSGATILNIDTYNKSSNRYRPRKRPRQQTSPVPSPQSHVSSSSLGIFSLPPASSLNARSSSSSSSSSNSSSSTSTSANSVPSSDEAKRQKRKK